MKLNTFADRFIEEMHVIYSIEAQLVEVIPQMADIADSSLELRKASQNHLEQTREHIHSIEEAFSYLNGLPKGKKYVAMEEMPVGEYAL